MDDNLLSNFRQPPRAEFASALYERINQPTSAQSISDSPGTRSMIVGWSPVLVGLSAILLVTLLFTFPPARAAAQDFLNLFRVRRFSALAIDPARLEQLRNSNIDFESLIGNNTQVVKQAGEPQLVAGPEAAAQLAGMKVFVPGTLPAGTKLAETRVQGEGVATFTADSSKLQSLLDVLQISDVKVPTQLNGASVTVRKPPIVMMRFDTGRDPLTFVQARSPEVTLPQGVNLAELGEIGLRIVGLNATEAHQFARSIDWHTTLLVPVPANAASFREVGVRNTTGLLITTGGTGGTSLRTGPNSTRQQSLLLWSEGEMVFALEGGPAGYELLDFANSLR